MAHTKPASGTLPPARRHKEDITNLLILRFQKLMRDGVLMPGALLPSERELAMTFGVARSSLRQAMKVLETMGVVTQKVGDGTYLSTDGTYVLSVPMDFLFLLDDISVEDLMELRLMLEPALAAKAAERATVEHVNNLKQSMRDMQEKGIGSEEVAAADLLFHRTIFRATGNALGSRLFHTIHAALFKMIASTAQVVQVEHTIRFHRAILQAIEQRNAKRAAICMTEHLEDARDLLLHQQKQQDNLKFRKHLAAGRELPVAIAKQPVSNRRRADRAIALADSR